MHFDSFQDTQSKKFIIRFISLSLLNITVVGLLSLTLPKCLLKITAFKPRKSYDTTHCKLENISNTLYIPVSTPLVSSALCTPTLLCKYSWLQ